MSWAEDALERARTVARGRRGIPNPVAPDSPVPGAQERAGRRLVNEKEAIGENTVLAGWVRGYLLDRRIILDGRTINRIDFPDILAVEAQLVKDFGPPIIYKAGDDDIGMSAHSIVKGTGSGNWSS